MNLHRGKFRSRQRLSKPNPPKEEAATVSAPKLVDELKERLDALVGDINPVRSTVERLTVRKDFAELKRLIGDIASEIGPIKENVESLKLPKDVVVPQDIAVSIGKIQAQLDRLEKKQADLEDQSRRMAETFSSAILGLEDKMDRPPTADGKASALLARSIDKLRSDLMSRKLRFIRDSNGDLAAAEVTTGPLN